MGMEEHHTDDQSHYEISLTAGQAFVAFVLLLLSLAASFAFGLMLGKGQADERLVVRKETPVVTEASLAPKKNDGRIVELGVDNDDFQATATATPAAPVTTDSSATTAIVEDDAPVTAATPAPAAVTAEAKPTPAVTAASTDIKPVRLDPPAPAAGIPYLAQLLSTGDQKTAEALAVKVINRGFNTAYVERGSNDKGPIFRVRVRFDSEAAARAAEPKLRELSKDVWITAK
jgi:hypothetical protein